MNDHLPRRAFLGRAAALGGGLAFAGGAAGLLGACSSDSDGSSSSGSGSTSKMAYQLGWLKDVQFAGDYMADSKGYWTKQGLDVSLLTGGPGVDSLPIVSVDKALTTIAQPDGVARANAKGGSFKIVAAKYQTAPYAITSLADKPIEGPKDMVGRKIGVSANNTATFAVLLKLNDIDPSSVTVVPVQFDPAPLVAGLVDGLLTFVTDEPINLAAQGVETKSFLFYDHGYKMIAGCHVVTEKTLADGDARERLTKFLRGDIQGWQAAIDDVQAATDLSVDEYSKTMALDPKRALGTLEATNELITARGAGTERGIYTLDDEGIAGSIAAGKASGVSMPSDLFVPDLLDGLFGSKMAL
ncbi:hypothetical protein BH10ACT1_BH10ACT1_07040 [soil metagenome]